jgi:lysyl-tRNA synthetase class 1
MDRARSLSQSVLKARYADVAWDMAPLINGARRDPEMARLAIDAYLATPLLSPAPNLFHRVEAVSRSLHLAILINDQSRVEAARLALIDLHREAVKSRSQWWNTFETLINNKRAGVTAAERDELVASLEGLLGECADPSDPGKFNPHNAESIVKRLVPIYRKSNKPSEIKRLHTVLGKTFEHFASIADPMLASVVLQTAVDAYRDAGLGDDSKRTRSLMEEKIGAAADAMVPILTDIEIKGEDMEKFLASVVVDNPGQSLANIAAQFLCNRPQLEHLLQEVAKEAPLQAILTQTIMAGDHVAAKVGSLDEDSNGRVIAQAVTNFAFDSIWLHQALATAVERHSLTPHHIVAWANRLGLFNDVGFMLEGVVAWYEGDTIKALHVLVPQIEAGLRNMVGKLGKPVTKPHGTLQGVGVSINMGDILNNKDIIDALGPDITLHFVALYADPRGRNLRNNLAHGLITRQAASRDATNWLIHSLLVFGIWDKLAQVRRPQPAAPDSLPAPFQ